MSLLFALLFAAAPAVEAVPPTSVTTGGTARVTADKAYYDHGEGYAYFCGRVFVDDAEYQLHADRAYVFMDGTNELKRIVALGNVAVTNDTKRAYGGKASYYRKSGMVVLEASEDAPAEVRDEAQTAAQVVRGKKIRFWTKTQQVEVQDAWIPVQRSGVNAKDIKDLLGR